jgi:hypothetical protein
MIMARYNIVSLWRTLRGLENAYRYYADFVAGIIQSHPSGRNLDFDVRNPPRPGWFDLCLPPMCIRPVSEIVAEMDAIAWKGREAAEAMTDLQELLSTGIPPMTEVSFIASELPGTRLMIEFDNWDSDVPPGFPDS